MSALAAEAELDLLELDLMESGEDDAMKQRTNKCEYRITTTFPRTGDEDEQARGGYYQWQREKY